MRAVGSHALQIHMNLKAREGRLECEVIGARLSRRTGMCLRCTESPCMWRSGYSNEALELEAAQAEDAGVEARWCGIVRCCGSGTRGFVGSAG